jgi:4'-phosphopantetheinyl transferase EntD
VKKGLARVKLKNLHCQKPLPGTADEETAGWKKGLAGSVVICKVWRLAIAL